MWQRGYFELHTLAIRLVSIHPAARWQQGLAQSQVVIAQAIFQSIPLPDGSGDNSSSPALAMSRTFQSTPLPEGSGDHITWIAPGQKDNFQSTPPPVGRGDPFSVPHA